MSWRAALGIFRLPAAAEIEAEVGAEIEHHLACKERELVDKGKTPEEARREARRLFGDSVSIRRLCVQIQRGDRTMLQRIHFVVTVLLLAAVLALAWSAHRSNKAALEAAAAAQALREEVEKELTEVLSKCFDTPEVRETKKTITSFTTMMFAAF